MSDPFEHSPVPRTALIAMGMVAVMSMALAAAGRYADFGRTEAVPETAATALVLETRTVQFRDRAEGGVSVIDVESGRQIGELVPGEDGFVRGVMRGLARGRRVASAPMDPPFEVTRWSDGRVTLLDLATGAQIDLNAFGPTNLAAFARFLPETPRQDARAIAGGAQ